MSKTVMLVDDFGARLSGAGYKVIEAQDGEAALQMLDGQAIGVIVTDLSMPRMDGITFLRHVRAHPRYKFTPVVMVTTETRTKAREDARHGGAQALLTKPVTPANLLATVARLCV
jgi:two-component system, chemotaxis family, chemotaxis protein CheY